MVCLLEEDHSTSPQVEQVPSEPTRVASPAHVSYGAPHSLTLYSEHLEMTSVRTCRSAPEDGRRGMAYILFRAGLLESDWSF
jgi:hypothetical protein